MQECRLRELCTVNVQFFIYDQKFTDRAISGECPNSAELTRYELATDSAIVYRNTTNQIVLRMYLSGAVDTARRNVALVLCWWRSQIAMQMKTALFEIRVRSRPLKLRPLWLRERVEYVLDVMLSRAIKTYRLRYGWQCLESGTDDVTIDYLRCERSECAQSRDFRWNLFC